MRPADGETGVWVKTEPTLDGKGYAVTLETSADVAVGLDRTSGIEYAFYVLDCAERAAYDAAVVRQLRKRLDVPLDAVGQMVTDLRNDRPELDHKWPIVLTPGVARASGAPFIAISTKDGGQPIGQWTADDARQHAGDILSAVVVADLDAGYYRALVGMIGLESDRSRVVIDDLGSFR